MKQFACLWFDLFTVKILALEFYESEYNSALFLNEKGTYIAIYVDNPKIIGSDFTVIENLKTSLSQKLMMINLSPSLHYLSIEVNISICKVVIT